MKSCQYCLNQNRCMWYANHNMSDVLGYMSSKEVDGWIDELERKANGCLHYDYRED